MSLNISLNEMAAALMGCDRFLILTHRRPDGDTVGSAAALCRILRAAGKAAFVAPNADATPRLNAFLEGLLLPEGEGFDTLVAVDIADESLLTPAMAGFKGAIHFCIDHHPSNKFFAAQTHMRAGAAAVGEIIFELAEALGIAPDVEALSAIYLALLTDTGCFLYSNTTALSHSIAAACMAGGVDFHRLNTEFIRKKTKARFEIERALMENLIFDAAGAVAGAALTRADIKEAGATLDDLDNLASLIIALEGVSCAILATEDSGGTTCKISVRTRAPMDGSALCARFGGGGHARAAGCTLEGGDPQAARARLMAAAVESAHV